MYFEIFEIVLSWISFTLLAKLLRYAEVNTSLFYIQMTDNIKTLWFTDDDDSDAETAFLK